MVDVTVSYNMSNCFSSSINLTCLFWNSMLSDRITKLNPSRHQTSKIGKRQSNKFKTFKLLFFELQYMRDFHGSELKNSSSKKEVDETWFSSISISDQRNLRNLAVSGWNSPKSPWRFLELIIEVCVINSKLTKN